MPPAVPDPLEPAAAPSQTGHATHWAPRPVAYDAVVATPSSPGGVSFVSAGTAAARIDERRERLAAFLGIVGLSFAVFFVRALFLEDRELLVRGIHLALIVVLAAGVLVLRRGRPLTDRQVRAIEFATLAAILVSLILFEWRFLLMAARDGGEIEGVHTLYRLTLGFFSVMLLYGLLVPNTWRRAALVVVPLSLAPILVGLVVASIHPEVRTLTELTSPTRFNELAIILALGALAALYGAHTINTLRREALEARALGQYRLRDLLGRGGMGEVYLADHRLLKRPAAIKLIRPEAAGDPRALARFELEVQATASLSHPNTIEVYDFGIAADGTFYYVMEFLPGLSLGHILREFGPMPPARVVYLLAQTCDALVEAHDQGLIHRDLKPGNIFASYRGGRHDVAKLLDFGLVKTVALDPASPQLSRDGNVRGSPLYMAPEQAMGRPLDPRCDLYGLGAVAYHLLTDRPPFEGESAAHVMVAHARDTVVPPSRYRPDLPADLEAVLLRCLNKQPADRYDSAAQLAGTLRSCACARDWDASRAAEWWAHARPGGIGR